MHSIRRDNAMQILSTPIIEFLLKNVVMSLHFYGESTKDRKLTLIQLSKFDCTKEIWCHHEMQFSVCDLLTGKFDHITQIYDMQGTNT